MNFDALGNIGDFIGGLAVVATLIYLAVQVRQNSHLVQASLEQARAQALREGMESDYVIELARDENAMALYLKGLRSFEDLDELERVRFSFLLGGILGKYESNMLMHQQGFLTDERWETQRGALRTHVAAPGGRSWWKLKFLHFTPSFRAIVNQELGAAGEEQSSAV